MRELTEKEREDTAYENEIMKEKIRLEISIRVIRDELRDMLREL